MSSDSDAPFGVVHGQKVTSFDITSPDGSTSANLITFGAAIHDLRIPIKGEQSPRSVILGFDEPEGYFANPQWHHGAVAGRVANRIANGQFTVDGVDHQITTNEPSGHTCHGGTSGLGHRVWKIVEREDNSATLEVVSPDGDQGFPGTVTARIEYSLPSKGVIRLEYTATTDKPTPISLTNHAFFNLDGTRGDKVGSTEYQSLLIHADHTTAVDDNLITTGQLSPVNGTPYDFRSSRPIKHADPETGKLFHYDTNYVLRKSSSLGELQLGAEMVSSNGDLKMECWTDQPGIQLFDGAPMDLKERGLGGSHLTYRTGVCLETQLFPDWIHRPEFRQSIIKPGEVYRHVTEYRFA
jgi:aldose 1-epimerase